MYRTSMISMFVAGGLAATLMAGESPSVAPVGKALIAVASQNDDAEIAAIKANIDAFSRAYKARDIKAIAALFASDAKLITDENELVEGRDAIAKGFEDHFAEEPNEQMDLAVTAVKMLTPELAVEAGTTKSISAPDATPEYGKYTALHIKRDGKWLMLLVRDMEGDPPSNHERLLPLAWMVGDWVDESPESVVATSCRWSPDKNYLMQEIRIQRAGKAMMQVSQRIGWDPLQKRIRAWVFDTEGGYGDSVWTQHEDKWVSKANFVRNDGVTASATNVFTRAGKDAYLWRSADRVLGDEILPTLEVTVVRKPPGPSAVNTTSIAPGAAKKGQPRTRKPARP